MYTNPNGITGKIQSLESIAQITKPHIITLAETKLKQNTPQLNNYTWITRNRTQREGGGVAILIRNDIKQRTKIVTDIENNDQEVLWIEFQTNNQQLYIGIFYGPQENTPIEETERQYSQLTTQIEQLKRKGEIILTGDFNAKLKTQTETINQNESRNGKLLRKLIKTTNLNPITTKPEYINWTRQNRKKLSEKSIIDYILITPKVTDHVKDIKIDCENIYTLRGKEETDHNTMILDLNLTLKTRNNKISVWNLNNKEGWKKYNEILNKNTENQKHLPYNTLIQNIHETLLQTIGKITIDKTKIYYPRDPTTKHLKKTCKHLRRLIRQKQKNGENENHKTIQTYIQAQKNLRKHLEITQKKIIQNRINKALKETQKNPNHLWKMKKKIISQNKNNISAPLITENNEKINNPEKAKEYIANYYENLYKAREGTLESQHWTNHITDTNRTILLSNPSEHNKQNDITTQELTKAIKMLKPKKANGPDNIPNEALINANQRTKNLLLAQFNHILATQDIPTQWQTSKIIPIYKGKGTRGKCSTERGITLASNIGKTFERIINIRSIPQINITEAQAGGQKGKATTDHIMTLNEILKIPRKNQPIYLTFLDVTKAFDKAWDEAIMYVMNKNGLKHPNWITMKNLNKNLTAKIMTNYGLTRDIRITNSIRQGGVLSGTQYSLLMDEINKEISKENIGIELPLTKTRIPALLWMDDVVLIADKENEMQRMLDITHHTASKYHIEFGQEKSQTMILQTKNNNPTFKLGNQILDETTTYKYLGITMNNKNNISDHIKKTKTKVEGAYQTVLQILHDPNFAAIQMKSAWKLLKTCILPIITYGLEAINIRQQDHNDLNKIWEAIIRRILQTPISTPKESLYIETGLVDITTSIHRNRLRMAARLLNKSSQMLKNLQLENNKNGWWTKTSQIMELYDIKEQDLKQTKKITNKIITTKTGDKFKEDTLNKAISKSKIQHLLQTNRQWNVEKTEPYLNQLTRNESSILFQARTRMLKIKNNYRQAYNNLICRLCKNEDETQIHILEKCQYIHTTQKLVTTQQEYFSENTNNLKKVASKLKTIMSFFSESINEKTPAQ